MTKQERIREVIAEWGYSYFGDNVYLCSVREFSKLTDEERHSFFLLADSILADLHSQGLFPKEERKPP